jgi:hypothetical protein
MVLPPNGLRKWQVGGTRLAIEMEKAQSREKSQYNAACTPSRLHVEDIVPAGYPAWRGSVGTL